MRLQLAYRPTRTPHKPNKSKPTQHVLNMHQIRDAHHKYGKETLSPEAIDEIPGLETLNIGDKSSW